MKNLINTVAFLILILGIIYLGISQIESSKKNRELADGISKMNIVHQFNENLINVEHNSRQVEYMLKEKTNKTILEKPDKSTILLLDLIKNDSLTLYFYIHENSCAACLEIEFNHIKQISDSLKIPIHFICNSRSWRFIKLLQKNYNLQNKFYRVYSEDAPFNTELFISPFYFVVQKKEIEFILTPLKEIPKRTLLYFGFLNFLQGYENS